MKKKRQAACSSNQWTCLKQCHQRLFPSWSWILHLYKNVSNMSLLAMFRVKQSSKGRRLMQPITSSPYHSICAPLPPNLVPPPKKKKTITRKWKWHLEVFCQGFWSPHWLYFFFMSINNIFFCSFEFTKEYEWEDCIKCAVLLKLNLLISCCCEFW